MGIATDCPGSSKECEENTFVEDLLYARYSDLQYWGIFNPSNSLERLFILDVRRCQRDWAKVTQLGGGRTRIPASARHQEL